MQCLRLELEGIDRYLHKTGFSKRQCAPERMEGPRVLAIFVVFFCTTPKEQKYVFHCNHLFKNTKSKVQTKIIYKTTLHIKHKTFNAKSTNYRYILNLFFYNFKNTTYLQKLKAK